MKMRIAAVVVGIAGIAACSGAGSSESTTTQGHVVLISDSYPADLVASTAVHIKADGTKEVKRVLITQDQLRTEEAERAAYFARSPSDRTPLDLTNDSGCAGADMWLYNYQVGDAPAHCGQQICFFNDGPSTDYADLSDYDLYPAALLIDGKYECARENNTWSGAVKSYYAGEQDGCLGASEDQDYAAGDAEYTNIANYSAEANVASGYVGYTSYLWLSSITTSGDTTGECYIYR